MLPILQIGPLALPTPAFVILLTAWLGLNLAERHAERSGLRAPEVYNLVMILLTAGVIGARLSYILRYPQVFAASPASMFSLNLGLFDLIGGLAIGALAGAIYLQRKSIPLLNALDALTPALAMLQLGIAIGHLASGAAFGAPSDLPWAIELWGAHRHPSQVYEILAAALILALVWPERNTERLKIHGMQFLVFLTLSAGARLFLETFRGDSLFILSGLRRAQVAAWLVLASSLVGIFLLKRKTDTITPQQGEIEPANGDNS